MVGETAKLPVIQSDEMQAQIRGDLARERGLARLPGAEQRDNSSVRQGGAKARFGMARDGCERR